MERQRITALFEECQTIFFETVFGALCAVSANVPSLYAISPNQYPLVPSALKRTGVSYVFSDIDFYGLMNPLKIIVSDYAGVLPNMKGEMTVWSHGAGYLDFSDISQMEITMIDLQTLDPGAQAAGAIVLCTDKEKFESIRRYASLGVRKGHLWNDAIDHPGIDAIMQPLVRKYWEFRVGEIAEHLAQADEIAALYAKRLGGMGMVDLIPTRYPKEFPIRLAPELYCQKETIYIEVVLFSFSFS